MSLALTLIIIAQVLGLCALFVSILRSPDGYEDEAGFHVGATPHGNETYYDAFAGRQPKRTLAFAKGTRPAVA